MESSSNSMNENKWQDISEEIKKIFKTAVKLLYEKGKMKHSQAKRYLSSGKVHTNYFCIFIYYLFYQPFQNHENIFLLAFRIKLKRKKCSLCLLETKIPRKAPSDFYVLFLFFYRQQMQSFKSLHVGGEGCSWTVYKENITETPCSLFILSYWRWTWFCLG